MNIMMYKVIVAIFLIIFITVISLGCLENNNQLSSDFTPIGKDTISQINDSNVSVSYTCEKQPIYFNLYNSYIINGNVTNTEKQAIANLTITATFHGRNNYYGLFGNNEGESCIYYIGPNDTDKFTIQKQYYMSIDIESYQVNVSY